VNLERWQEIKAALDRSLELKGASRRAYIDEITANDSQLRLELESLLAAHEGSDDSFMNVPAAAIYPVVETSAFQADMRIGNYRLVREIGQGGMGQVWLAEQVSPVRRLVALKLIRAGMYDERVAHRFQAERQSLATMDHPAIAKVFDAGSTPQGQPYFVMEYVPGIPITDYCDQKRLKIRDRLELFIKACEGVQHAHQKAIIHRDLKPENILIVEVDGKAVPRIIDFGLAKPATPQAADQTLYTQYGQFIGTPGFMSPEQVDPHHDIDTRTDVYSLGVILYVLLTGLQPFQTRPRQRSSIEEWLRQLREDEPPRLSSKITADRATADNRASERGANVKQLAEQLRGDLEWISLKALERDRERRYGTPSELVADLRRQLNHEPVAARPASAVYQLRKFVRRHWAAIAVVGVVFLTLAGGLGATSYEAKIASAQRDAALQAQLRSLTQTAAGRLRDGDIPAALSIILDVLPRQASNGVYAPEALNVFQEARAADAQVLAFTGHKDTVTTAIFSPDGKNLVTSSYDQTARIWDVATGREINLLSGHTAGVNFAMFSPDGRYIATASRDKSARIWDAASGRELMRLNGHQSAVWSAVFSPDGRSVVTASSDKTARVWDAATGQELKLLSGHTESVHFAAFSPDGQKIVTSSWDKTVRIWDAASGRQILLLDGHTSRVWRAEFSPDGSRVVSASDDKTARIWDATTGRQTALLSGHTSRVISAEFSPDGQHVATSSEDTTVRIWDAATGQQLLRLSGYTGRLNFAAFSPDGRRIVAASYDNTARIWDATSDVQIMQLGRHTDRVFSAAFSPDGGRIVTASWDKTARVWNAADGQQVLLLSGHSNLVASAAFSADGSRIVTASNDTTAIVWDAATGQPITTLSGNTGRVFFAGFSPDGRRVVTAADDKTALVWDVATGGIVLRLNGHKERVLNAAYSPDGRRIVTSSTDKTVRIWNAADGQQVTMLNGLTDVVESAAFSPDSTHIVTASDDKTARIWDAATGQQIRVLSGHSDIVGSAAFSADGKRIVTASFDKTARIWDAATGQQLGVLSGHSDLLETAAFSPDGLRIVTASDDMTARIWDARTEAVKTQIAWAAAAQFDPLQSSERFQLGLPLQGEVLNWSKQQTKCDESAGAHYDPDRRASGVLLQQIVGHVAVAACAADNPDSNAGARAAYQRGRAQTASGNFPAAKQAFEQALGAGYRSARIDLGNLLLEPAAGLLDPIRAVSLYERAWQDGVPIAAFELGRFYEYGVQDSSVVGANSRAPDPSKEWFWYSRGAGAGEPNALARFAERREAMAIAEKDAQKKNADLLDAFRYYAAAAERAHREEWPDEAWKAWRYRRATLSRLLARAGMMQAVADSYSTVQAK
jgi:WD40 repeat protein